MLFLEFVFWLCVFLIFYCFVGYPVSLFLLRKLIKRKNTADTSMRPSVSIIIPAHNEEQVIRSKLINLTSLNYPNDLLEIIIASDNSTDRTNEIVEQFISEKPEYNIKLYKVNKRQGKTNAQNEAVKIAEGEILVFSDANAILHEDAIIHLVSSFTSEDIIYVTGRLKYINNLEHVSSDAESSYWEFDLLMREIESDIATVTAGNGALYAIPKKDYVEFSPISSHDSAMPLYAGLNHKRAIYNSKAIAYEKAGENSKDEFNRKVRMFRGILSFLFKDLKKLNVFKYRWFSYFYFCHRTLRYSLFFLHIVCFVVNLILLREGIFYLVFFVLQCLFYFLASTARLLGFNSKVFYMPFYYCMTLVAQLYGAFNQLTGRSKPFWEKAESTR